MSTAEALDVAWILVAAGLVMFMQAGFSSLESGLVRTKNSINVAAKNFADFCLTTAVFWAFGFALMFGDSVGGWFGSSGVFFSDTTALLAAFFIFQVGFAGTATTIMSGAVAERMKFSSYLIMALVMSAVIYPVYGHWAWGSLAGGDAGWLEDMGFIDFAGSTVVHSMGGWMALAVGTRLRSPTSAPEIGCSVLTIFSAGEFRKARRWSSTTTITTWAALLPSGCVSKVYPSLWSRRLPSLARGVSIPQNSTAPRPG